MTRATRKPKAPAATAEGRDSIAGAVALGSRKVKEAALEVADLLTKALEIAKNEGSVGWVTAWLDDRDELEGYGYTVELQERIDALEEELGSLESAYPDGLPLNLSVMEQVKVQEFFQDLRDPLKLTRPADPFEALLQRCRGFKLEELSRVLDWMDSYALGELPFGPTEELKREIAEQKALAAEHEDQLHNLRGEMASYKRNASKWQRHEEKQATRLAEVEQALVDVSAEAGRLRLVLQDPRVAFTASHLEHLPLEALEWVVAQETAP